MDNPAHVKLCLPLTLRVWEREVRLDPLIELLCNTTHPAHPCHLLFLAPDVLDFDVLTVVSSFLMDPSSLDINAVKKLSDNQEIQQEVIDLSFAIYRGEINPMHIYEFLSIINATGTPKWMALALGYSRWIIQLSKKQHKSHKKEMDPFDLFPVAIGEIICEMNNDIITISNCFCIPNSKESTNILGSHLLGINTVSLWMKRPKQRSDTMIRINDQNIVFFILQRQKWRWVLHSRYDKINQRRRLCFSRLFADHLSSSSMDSSHSSRFNSSIVTNDDFDFNSFYEGNECGPGLIESKCAKKIRDIQGWIHLVIQCDFNADPKIDLDPCRNRIFINGIQLDHMLNARDVNGADQQTLDDRIPRDPHLDYYISPTDRESFDAYLSPIKFDVIYRPCWLGLMLYAADFDRAMSFNRYPRCPWIVLDFYLIKGVASPEEFGYLGIHVAPRFRRDKLVIIGFSGAQVVSDSLITPKLTSFHKKKGKYQKLKSLGSQV